METITQSPLQMDTLLPIVASLANACPNNFVSLGSFCYHFSDVKENWDVARGACGGIGSIKDEYIIPAVLDLGTAQDNQLLLREVNRQEDKNYWLGGYLENERWQWIYNKEKDIDLYANYWLDIFSNRDEKCLKTANTTYKRTFIEAANCDTKMKVICQIIPGYYGFRDIGAGKYYFSTVNDSKGLYWDQARNVCQSMTPPANFDYVDLASLRDPDTDQQLLKIIAQYGSAVWLGGYTYQNDTYIYNPFTNMVDFVWIDERRVDQTSYFIAEDFLWHYDEGNLYADITTDTGKPRATIRAYRNIVKKNYVCQAYKN